MVNEIFVFLPGILPAAKIFIIFSQKFVDKG